MQITCPYCSGIATLRRQRRSANIYRGTCPECQKRIIIGVPLGDKTGKQSVLLSI